jgi:LysM repeat protein
MHIKYLLIILTLLTTLIGLSQKQTTVQYINKWKNEAMLQMKAHKIPASITLAQGILESGNGNSMLAVKANNHFGIKCHSSWTGKKVYKDDDKRDECFRKYNSASESFNDHADFLKKRRYAGLFELKITDYKGWAKGLKKAGYATNPKYPKLLIGLIERYNLTKYDNLDNLLAVKEKDTVIKQDVINVQVKEDEEVIIIGGKHKIKTSNNKVKYIIIKKGDTFTKLGHEFDMRLWQFHKYNDFNKGHILQIGEKVYVKPKRCKAKESYHIVKKGETIHSISQLYGVKLKALYRKNRMIIGSEPKIGKKLNLRKKKK